jgi:hypothetical protein
MLATSGISGHNAFCAPHTDTCPNKLYEWRPFCGRSVDATPVEQFNQRHGPHRTVRHGSATTLPKIEECTQTDSAASLSETEVGSSLLPRNGRLSWLLGRCAELDPIALRRLPSYGKEDA